jgi:predicted MFS family arabinose efflux permease
MGAGSAAVWNYGRTLLIEAGASEGVSVAAWIALGAGGTAAILTARRLSALGPRAAWAVTTAAATVASLTLALAPGVTAVALAACAVFGWGYTAGTGALIAWTTRIDPARAPSGTSLLFVVLVLGQAVGAAVLGAVASGGGLVVAFLVAAVVTFAATLAPLRQGGRRDHHSEPTTQMVS